MAFTDDVRDWQYEVANGDTVLGFMEWLEHREEAERFTAERDERDSKSSLVQTVEAFEQLQRVQQYLFSATYSSDGMGSMSWAHWYDDIASAVDTLRKKEQTLRKDITYRLGARTIW